VTTQRDVMRLGMIVFTDAVAAIPDGSLWGYQTEHIFISAKEVMFLSAFICLFVSRVTQMLLSHFHKIRWKLGTWATEEAIRVGGKPDHVMLGLG